MLQNSILIVDDDVKLVQVLRTYFEREQFVVYTAFDGRSALDLLRRYEPQILILDLMMPDMVPRNLRLTGTVTNLVNNLVKIFEK